MDQPASNDSPAKAARTRDGLAVVVATAGAAIVGVSFAAPEKIATSPRIFELGIATGLAFFIGGGTYVLKDWFEGVSKSNERSAIAKRALHVSLTTIAAFIVCCGVIFFLLENTFKFVKDEQASSHGKIPPAQAASPKTVEEKKPDLQLGGTSANVEILFAGKASPKVEPGNNPEVASTNRIESLPAGRQASDQSDVAKADAQGSRSVAAAPSTNNGATTAPRAEEPVKYPTPPAAQPMVNATAAPIAEPKKPETTFLYGNEPRSICGMPQMSVRHSTSAKPSPTGWILYSADFLAPFAEQPLVFNQSFKINDCVLILRKIDPDARRFDFEVELQR